MKDYSELKTTITTLEEELRLYPAFTSTGDEIFLTKHADTFAEALMVIEELEAAIAKATVVVKAPTAAVPSISTGVNTVVTSNVVHNNGNTNIKK